MKIKRISILLALACACAGALLAQTYSGKTERATFVGLHATWTEGQVVPDTVTIRAQLTKRIENNTDATDGEVKRAEISFDGLGTDPARNVQVGAGPALTERQVTLYYLKMVAQRRANPAP